MTQGMDCSGQTSTHGGTSKEVSGKLKQHFAYLTDDTVLLKESTSEKLLGRLQHKLGKTKEDLRTLIELLKKGKDYGSIG